VRAGPRLAAALYALLVASAALALWGRPLPNGALPSLAAAAPWVFLAFTAVFAVYRLTLVRSKKYPASKAFFQVGTALIFFGLLSLRARPADAVDSLKALMSDANPQVRALAAEVARYRVDGIRYGPDLVRALEDSDREVRREAHATLVRLAGQDLGGPEDPAAVRAWGERFR